MIKTRGLTPFSPLALRMIISPRSEKGCLSPAVHRFRSQRTGVGQGHALPSALIRRILATGSWLLATSS